MNSGLFSYHAFTMDRNLSFWSVIRLINFFNNQYI